MPDIHDAELDARPTEQDLCEHENKTYQPYEYDTNIGESYSCDDCGTELDIPEPDEDTLRGDR